MAEVAEVVVEEVLESDLLVMGLVLEWEDSKVYRVSPLILPVPCLVLLITSVNLCNLIFYLHLFLQHFLLFFGELFPVPTFRRFRAYQSFWALWAYNGDGVSISILSL